MRALERPIDPTIENRVGFLLGIGRAILIGVLVMGAAIIGGVLAWFLFAADSPRRKTPHTTVSVSAHNITVEETCVQIVLDPTTEVTVCSTEWKPNLEAITQLEGRLISALMGAYDSRTMD